jgi:hypothetical protein
MGPYPGIQLYARYAMSPSAIWGARCSPPVDWPCSSRASSRNRHAATLPPTLCPLWTRPLLHPPCTAPACNGTRELTTWEQGTWDRAVAPVQGGRGHWRMMQHQTCASMACLLATVTLPTAPEGTEERLQQSAPHIHPAHAFSVQPVSLATQHANMPPPTVQAHTTTHSSQHRAGVGGVP